MRSLLIACMTIFLCVTTVWAQQSDFPPPSTSTTAFNKTCTGTASTLFAYDGTRVGWTMHPENGNIRVTFGNAFGWIPPNPTSSIGAELLGGGYFQAFPTTNPTDAVLCISETGSTVNVSGSVDNR